MWGSCNFPSFPFPRVARDDVVLSACKLLSANSPSTSPVYEMVSSVPEAISLLAVMHNLMGKR